jgi:hypothetical protein
MKLTLRVWRQKNADADGAMSTYEVDDISGRWQAGMRVLHRKRIMISEEGTR